LTKAVGISADGKTIIGQGYDPSGNDAAWVAHVPEPSSITLALFGMLGLGSTIRFRQQLWQS
jgi:hypothetical protein